MNKGLTGQYYRMAGSNNYRCQSCRIITNGREFEPIEFSWKEDYDKWRVWADKNVKDGAKEVIKNIEYGVKNPKVQV